MAHKKLNKFDSLIMIGKLACRRLVLTYRSNQDNKRISKKNFTKKFYRRNKGRRDNSSFN